MKVFLTESYRCVLVLLVFISMVLGLVAPSHGCMCVPVTRSPQVCLGEKSQGPLCPSCQEGQGCCCLNPNSSPTPETDHVRDMKCPCLVFPGNLPENLPSLLPSEGNMRQLLHLLCERALPQACSMKSDRSVAHFISRNDAGSSGGLLARYCRLTI